MLPSILQNSRSLEDETEYYSPIKHTKLVSDGEQFFEVPTRPSSPPFSYPLDTEKGLTSVSPVAAASTSTHPPLDLATTISPTAPAAFTSDPSSSASLPSTLTTSTNGPQPAMSPAAARAIIGAYILASGWFEAHELEPRVNEVGVPECALLLASPGDSIWACFFKRTRRNGATIFTCAGCSHKADRLNRAVDHQRAEWNHKPFACEDLGWYGARITVAICFLY